MKTDKKDTPTLEGWPDAITVSQTTSGPIEIPKLK